MYPWILLLGAFRLVNILHLAADIYVCIHIYIRVWKGIFGIRDSTKLRCGNRENDNFIDGIRDLTVPREAGLTKNWARGAGFLFACLSGMLETVTIHRFLRPKQINQATANWCLLSNQTPHGVSG